MERIIGIDLGGTHLRIGLVRLYPDIELESHKIFPTSKLNNEENGINALSDLIREMLIEWDVPVQRICIGFPSVISKDKKMVMHTTNVKGFNKKPIPEILTQKIGIDTIVEKDVNLLLRYDIEMLKLHDKSSVIGIYIGTGLGNSIYINNDIYSGASGAAGELGHIPITGNMRTCNCGNIGCAETIMAGLYLKELIMEFNQEEKIYDFFLNYNDHPRVKKFVESLSIPIATEINILDPEICILGGGVVNMVGFPIDTLIKHIKEKLRKPYPFETVGFLKSETESISGVLGGAYYLKHLNNKYVSNHSS